MAASGKSRHRPCKPGFVRGPRMSLAISSLSSGVGMILVALVAVWSWRRVAGESARWFWIGAGLWTVAVLVKVVIALGSNALVIGFLRSRLPHALFVAAGGF